MKLQGTIQNISILPDQDMIRMYSLMTTYYDNVKHEKFLQDLAEKDGVLLLYDEHGDIQGFTTFMLIETDFQGGTVHALYSGDTIVDKAYWGQRELFREYGRLFAQFLKARKEPLYWFLLTKGIRTYLMLPLFFETFYPNYHTATPLYDQQLIGSLARKKFGEFYLNAQDIVRVIPQADRLQEDVAHIPEHKKPNPHVCYFLERNPGYIEGDELVCLARISPENLTRIARRFVKI